MTPHALTWDQGGALSEKAEFLSTVPCLGSERHGNSPNEGDKHAARRSQEARPGGDGNVVDSDDQTAVSRATELSGLRFPRTRSRGLRDGRLRSSCKRKSLPIHIAQRKEDG